ncbi:hypothetical protein QYF36_015871 [Acer negundo]|nr:hypothetical protein QYF36_015871 [Acer negundo]
MMSTAQEKLPVKRKRIDSITPPPPPPPPPSPSSRVGDGDTDHCEQQWSEDMTTLQHAYKVDERNPGSDVAGETAAAMAAASIVFRKLNPHFSHLLLHHAKQATDNHRYLNYVLENAHDFGGITWAITEFSWDVKYAGLQIIVSMVVDGRKTQGTQARTGSIDSIPFKRRDVSTAAFLLSVYGDYLDSTNQTLRCHRGTVAPREILTFAKSQLDPNPNVVVGALVGGPDYKDQFNDQQSNLMQTEACAYNSATFVGVLAKLHRLNNNDS